MRPIVIAQKREEAERFPFADVTVVPKPATAFPAADLVPAIARGALDDFAPGNATLHPACSTAAGADLLHIYFGHIAVHLLPLIRSNGRKPSVVSFHGADVMVDLEKPAYRAATPAMLDAVRLVLVRSESLRASA